MNNEIINTKREKMLKQIATFEWDFFTKVNNFNRRAYCQDNSVTFIFSRLCYWSIYNDVILNSYMNDLINAKENNRNLLTEKYAYIMKYTDTEYFKKIEKYLPDTSNYKNTLIHAIMLIYMKWEEDVRKNNPGILDNNRDLYNPYKSTANTSIESYFRGELNSYSESTLNLILKYYLSAFQKKINLVEKNLNLLSIEHFKSM